MAGSAVWAYAQLDDPGDRLTRVQGFRVELRDAFDPLMCCVRVIVLEGPAPAAEAAKGVQRTAAEACRALWRVTEGDPGAARTAMIAS
ncbi:hypothetical protein ACFVYG_26975 [Streptomyces sp. NPDC058256]|uniref:hypothetical protein n=1 Tax=Streptomyces sp. NPDC058256 TaxID=3346408 RepID=UPI0036EAC23D